MALTQHETRTETDYQHVLLRGSRKRIPAVHIHAAGKFPWEVTIAGQTLFLTSDAFDAICETVPTIAVQYLDVSHSVILAPDDDDRVYSIEVGVRDGDDVDLADVALMVAELVWPEHDHGAIRELFR